MNTRQLVIGGLALMAVVHVGVPLSMIQRREQALRKGDRFLFKTEPVDPYDAFRGRYVALRVADRVPVKKIREFARGQKVYVLVETGADGFSSFSGIATEPPDDVPYMTTRIRYAHYGGTNVQVHVPFDRYYMNERLAPEAERLYREHSRPGKHDAHIAVRVRHGFAVLEELHVCGKPILEFMREGT